MILLPNTLSSENEPKIVIPKTLEKTAQQLQELKELKEMVREASSLIKGARDGR